MSTGLESESAHSGTSTTPDEPETGDWTGGWTGALRRRAVRALPPDKLLPDTQPAYMASWIYVFGVLTLAAFLVVLASGCVLAIEGPAWWHTSNVGHYFNSLHLWSVDRPDAHVAHRAAARGRRRTRRGAPAARTPPRHRPAATAARNRIRRRTRHPGRRAADRGGAVRRRARTPEPDPYSFGSRPYDLVKEFTIALVAVLCLTIVLATVFSSPDDHPLTIATWAKTDSADFTATALAELDGSSGTATYGPPFNTASQGQKLGPLALANLAGVTYPIDTAQVYVLDPLKSAPQTAPVSSALPQYTTASTDQQNTWTGNYSDALTKANGDPTKIARGDYGPVQTLLGALLTQAQAGSLDGQLLTESGDFYQTDYTLPLLFLADGSYLASLAGQDHLAGDQWGMMNETGNYPGQAWLWLHTFWYQVSPYDHSDNGDALVWGTMAILTLAFVFVPFIPGLRSIPRYVPVYRLIWRRHYHELRTRE